MDSLVLEYKLSEEAFYKSFMEVIFKKSSKRLWIFMFFISLFFICITIFNWIVSREFELLSIMWVFIFMFIILYRNNVNKRIKKMAETHATTRSETVMTITREGVAIANAFGEDSFKYEDLCQIDETNSTYLLYPTVTDFIFIPKSAVKTEADHEFIKSCLGQVRQPKVAQKGLKTGLSKVLIYILIFTLVLFLLRSLMPAAV